MERFPKVSIIIPVYNVEQSLSECLDSVVNQTLVNIEIICVNDGSTDCSDEILERYARKDNRITAINRKYCAKLEGFCAAIVSMECPIRSIVYV